MFDALLKSKFYSKCKTTIKITKTRIEMIKRKRSAMEKFLKKDIIDLLKDGLDINAYGRAEGLIIELNMSACYNFVGEFCVSLLKQVSLMDKQRDCPEECKEAVSSLIYAAARLADLPELRALRDIFLAKYGNSLEANINQEFIRQLKAMPPTKEMKIRLLQDIAMEMGKSWNSKALEQKLYIPPSYNNGLSEEEPINRIKKNNTENKKRNSSVPSSPRKLNDLPSYRTIKSNVDLYKLQEHKNNVIHTENTEKDVNSSAENKSVLEKEVRRSELNEKKPFQSKFSPPPPYHRRISTEMKYENGVGEKNNEMKYYQKKFAPVSYRGKKSDQDEDLVHDKNAGHGENSENTSGKDIKNKSNERNEHEEKSGENLNYQSKFAPPAVEEKTKPKPKSVRSVRSRRSMVPPDEAKIMKKDDILVSIRKELATKPGYVISNEDEDERDINKVLTDYFKRNSPRSGKGRASFGGELSSTKNKKNDPGRSSLSDAKSVHPKLPNYDDFVTRVGYEVSR